MTEPKVLSDVERVKSLAYYVANAKLGEGETMRCEGPTDFEKRIAREWVVRVLKAITALNPVPVSSDVERVDLPCPFCGEQENFARADDGSQECGTCGAYGPTPCYGHGDWNTRAYLALSERVGGLEALLKRGLHLCDGDGATVWKEHVQAALSTPEQKD